MSEQQMSEHQSKKPKNKDYKLHVLQDNNNNIRFAKTQQWLIGVYVLSIFGVLVVAKEQTFVKDIKFSVIDISLFLVAVVGVFLVIKYQWDMAKWRSKSEQIEEDIGISEEDIGISEEENGKNRWRFLLYQPEIPILISVTIIVGLFVACLWK